MIDDFYRAFEERYYAPQAIIKQLRRQYLPFIQPLTSLYPGTSTFDAGCGRGEWLELMQEQGFSAQGIDLDEGMLAACKEKGLQGQLGNAIDGIQDLQDESQSIVTAFHVVEHISFEELRVFVNEAFRTLKPGGLLIMETPNPENITVATCNFYLDPTHEKPIPPQLLSFVAEYTGFERVKVIRLQENPELLTKSNPTLNEVFSGASPDYAVIAQKNAENEVLELFDTTFAKDYGLAIDTLTDRYQLALDTKIEQVESKIGHLLSTNQQYLNQLQAIYSSRSWRITAPMRWCIFQLRLIRTHGLKKRLKSLFIKIKPKKESIKSSESQKLPESQMTPHARRIYQDLKAAIEKNKENQ